MTMPSGAGAGFRLAGAAILLAGLAACAAIPPAGPAVMGLPGKGKTFDAFRQDDAACRAYAAGRVPPGETTYGMQSSYDVAYTQCMVARGDRVTTPPAAALPAYPSYPAYPAFGGFGDYDDFYGPDYDGALFGFGVGGFGWGGPGWGGGWGGPGWHDGGWHGGDWHGGDWHGGDWHGGDWHGGGWHGGFGGHR